MASNSLIKEERKFKIFLSYAREDEESARRLYNDLKNSKFPIEPWLDKENILPGEDWNREIKKAIKESDFVILIFSSTSVQKRGYIQKEIKFIIEVLSEFPPGYVFVISVRLDKCNIPYDELEKYQHQDLFPHWNKGIERILKSIAKNKNINTTSLVYKKEQETEKREITSFSPFEKHIFVGREDYIHNKIKNLLKEPGSRVSIVGPGGSGKTQLAFKALHQYYEEDKITDLVIPVYLSVIASQTIKDNNIDSNGHILTFRRFLNAIGSGLRQQNALVLSEQEFEQLEIKYCKEIILNILKERKHPIIYVDNFETLSNIVEEQIDQDIQMIFDFLDKELPRQTSILITSRNKNNFLAANRLELEGLSIDEGIELFIRFSISFKNHFIDKNAQKLLKEIAIKAGGHPLSIEILSKTYEGGGLSELETIYDTLPKGKNRLESIDRLQSLHNCFNYSIEKLDKYLQMLLPSLTILKSPFPSEGVEKIFGIQQSERHLVRLYNKSLLNRIEEDEYGTSFNHKFWLYSIHPALRNYLEDIYQDFIKNKESEQISYFCNYYYNLIADIYNSWGKDDHTNFFRLFNQITKSEISDFDRSIEFAINIKGEEEKLGKQIGANIASYLGLIYHNLGYYDKSIQYHKKALKINEELKNDMNMASEYTNIGLIYYRKGQYDEALQYHKKALPIYEELKNRRFIASNSGDIGLVHYKKGQYDEALPYHKKALEIDEELKNRVGIARDFGNIGDVYSNKGQYDEALQYYTRGLEIDEELKDMVNIAWDYASIGKVYHNKKQYDVALQYYNKALKINEELKDMVNMAKNYAMIGEIYCNKKQYDEALQYHKSALHIGEELKNNLYLVKNYCAIGYVHLYKNDLNEAKLVVDNAIKVIREFEQETQRKHPFRDMAYELLSLLEKTK